MSKRLIAIIGAVGVMTLLDVAAAAAKNYNLQVRRLSDDVSIWNGEVRDHGGAYCFNGEQEYRIELCSSYYLICESTLNSYNQLDPTGHYYTLQDPDNGYAKIC